MFATEHLERGATQGKEQRAPVAVPYNMRDSIGQATSTALVDHDQDEDYTTVHNLRANFSNATMTPQ